MQQAQAQFFIELALLFFDVQDGKLALDVPQAQKPGNQLRSHGRISRARHAQRHTAMSTTSSAMLMMLAMIK